MCRLRFLPLCGCPRRCSTLVLRALAFTENVGLTIGYTRECVYALAMRVTAAFAALALQETVGCYVHLDGYRKPNR